MSNDITRAAFDGVVTIVFRRLDAEASVVEIEASIESGSRSGNRIENQRAYEGGSLITVLVQNIGQIGQSGGQGHSEIIDVVVLRIRTGENRRVGRGG